MHFLKFSSTKILSTSFEKTCISNILPEIGWRMKIKKDRRMKETLNLPFKIATRKGDIPAKILKKKKKLTLTYQS